MIPRIAKTQLTHTRRARGKSPRAPGLPNLSRSGGRFYHRFVVVVVVSVATGAGTAYAGAA
jgi:hypothetical protein